MLKSLVSLAVIVSLGVVGCQPPSAPPIIHTSGVGVTEVTPPEPEPPNRYKPGWSYVQVATAPPISEDEVMAATCSMLQVRCQDNHMVGSVELMPSKRLVDCTSILMVSYCSARSTLWWTEDMAQLPDLDPEAYLCELSPKQGRIVGVLTCTPNTRN